MEAAKTAAPARRNQVKKNPSVGPRSSKPGKGAAAPSSAQALQGQEVRPDGDAVPSQEPAVKQEQPAGKIGQKKRRKRMDTREVLKQMEAEGVEPQRMKMTDLIWRAEALERLKAKEEPVKKAPVAKRGAQQVRVPEAIEEPMAPQVQIVDGRIVINEQSLVVSSREAARTEVDFTRVEENVQKLNYHSYSNRTPWERWKADDTDKFYKALEQFGTDFGIIQQLFPGRTRRQVKAKYKNEEKCNPRRLADALNHKGRGHIYHEDLVEMLRPPAADEVEELVHGDIFLSKEDEELSLNVHKNDELETDAGAADALVKKDEVEVGQCEVDAGRGPASALVIKEGEGDMPDAPETEGQFAPTPPPEEYKDTEHDVGLAPESPPKMALFSYQMI